MVDRRRTLISGIRNGLRSTRRASCGWLIGGMRGSEWWIATAWLRLELVGLKPIPGATAAQRLPLA